MNIAKWFHAAWPEWSHRAQLARDYQSLGQMPRLLADIALRGGVFAPRLPARDLYEAGINEGRRQLALETIRIAGTDPAELQKFCLAPALTAPQPSARKE